jgi:hypothetical protein
VEEKEPTYFLPRVAKHSHTTLPACLDCRQWWSIIAQAHDNIVQLYCLPLGWKEPAEDGDFEEEVMDELPFYGFVREVVFYGDDGKSSLSSGNDSGSGKEGRQNLGIPYQEEKLELWLASYDSLLWQAVPFESILMDPSEVKEHCTRTVQAMPDISEEAQELVEDDIMWAQCK